MSDFSSYFTDPCEVVTIVCASDGITVLGKYSFRGYAKSMNRFFQICTLFTWEMSYLGRIHGDVENVIFETYANVLRSGFYGYIKRGEVKSLKEAIQQRVDDLKQYRFKSQRIFAFTPESDATYLNRKEYEITIDRIFKWILKMRQYRINFYERILQEYKPRRDQYNQHLRKYLENEGKNPAKGLDIFSIDSVLAELGANTENTENNGLSKEFYYVSNQSWYLKDLLKLDNPESDRFTKRLPRFRTRGLHAHPEGLKFFFEFFSIFKEEMSFIMPDEPDKSFFERVLTVLKRDFTNEFEQQGDLENIIIEFIEKLEKFEFLSLPKDQLFNKLSKMIYRLRTRRIKFYEAMLADYMANKKKYDAVM